MSLYKRYETNKELENDGAWVDFGDGVNLRIRRYKSPVVQEERRRLERPYRNILDRGETLPEDIAKKLLVEQFAKAVVVDWKGVTNRDGKELEFSTDNVRQLFDDLPDFLLEVFAKSAERDTFQEETKEEAAKNLSAI